MSDHDYWLSRGDDMLEEPEERDADLESLAETIDGRDLTLAALSPSARAIDIHKGMFAIVDTEDYESLNQWRWWPQRNGGSTYYATRSQKVNGIRRFIQMHRLIMKAQAGQYVDHVNGNGLDNRKANLRFCTRSQNGANRRKLRGDFTSIFTGVHLEKRSGKYRACLRINKKLVSLGYFLTEIDAAEAYNRAAKEYFGSFARLNEIPQHGS